MRHFACTNCGNEVFFSNVTCLRCGYAVGFDPGSLGMIAMAPSAPGSGVFQPAGSGGAPLRYCANAAHDACNWLVEDATGAQFCSACALNRTIPDLSQPDNLEHWQELEAAKKRLIYSLLRFGLPVDASHIGKGRLTFDFVGDAMTGHLDGVITVNIREADAVERERARMHFEEPYRTLLGHLRHESGHFYWSVLVDGTGWIDEFRALFGDERQDYGEALARHHAEGSPGGWQERFVSEYASAHPWEDWAESWAHYIHMVDAVETADAEGFTPRAAGIEYGASWPFREFDAYRADSFDALRDRWIPLTIALNRLNRSLGHSDFYGFVTPQAAYAKMAFVHRVVRQSAGSGG